MIRTPGKRMTVAQLKHFMDRRFDAVNEKLDSIAASLKLKSDHHDHVLDGHDRRIKDLETGRRTPSDIIR
jgi:hypothetical protein